jgi:tRNA(adenine34) deaminase
MHGPTQAIVQKTISEIDPIDLKMMWRCIELSKAAGKEREFPFASVIARDGNIIAEATNRVIRDGDVTRHAELLAVSKAQGVLGKKKLNGCTLYSNVEPCAMCSFPIREAKIARVVFSLQSPYMGGYTRWNVLRDEVISNKMHETFGDVPEVVVGVLAHEAERVWRNWNPIIWRIIQSRGCFEGPLDLCMHHPPPRPRNSFRTFLRQLNGKSRVRE